MHELIKIENKNGIETCNSRDLHNFLEIRTRHNDWILNRIVKYDFKQDIDYILLTEKLVTGNNADCKMYYISIEMAKELSMVENNEKGKQARKYFIECENKLKINNKIENMFIEFMKQQTETNKILLSLIQNNQPKQIEIKQDYYSLLGYMNLKNIDEARFSEMICYGKEASRISRSMGKEIRKIPDERFGTVNSYHVEVLKLLFEI